ncbi:MAG: hypothetical protein SVU32_05560 [Candidatus Nanohaloarchaea archaeon]|nr:hypothetical protein [Candidatus Nanohaloarchaea archaeon]
MTERDMTDDHLRTYGFNLRTALQTLEGELAGTAGGHHVEHTDIDEIVGVEPEEVSSDAADTEDAVDGEDEDERFEDPVADYAFVDEFLDYFGRVREELDVLLKQYEDPDSDYLDEDELEGVHDPVEISAETGLPVYRTSHHTRHGLSDIRMDRQDVDEQVSWLSREFRDYVEGKDWEDEHDLASSDVSGADREAFNALFEDLESTAQLEILSGNFPEFQHTHVFNVEYWNDLENLDTVKRGEKNLDVFQEQGDRKYFTLHTADFSEAKKDSFLFYGLAGFQEQDKKWYHFTKNLPVTEEDDKHKISAEVNEALDHTFDWSPERVLHNFNLLGEKFDVTYGENVETATAEMMRVGPFYFQGMTRPPTTEQGVEMTEYGDEEALRENEPASYISSRVGAFLEDNPDTYVLTLERKRATRTPDDDTQVETELFFVTPDAAALEEYIPDQVEGEETVRTNVLETRVDDEDREELAALYEPGFDPEEDGYRKILSDRPENYRPFEETVGDGLEEQVVAEADFEDTNYEEVMDE